MKTFAELVAEVEAIRKYAANPPMIGYPAIVTSIANSLARALEGCMHQPSGHTIYQGENGWVFHQMCKCERCSTVYEHFVQQQNQ